GAWAYRYPAKVSRHLQLRLETLPAEVQAIGWKAQVRLCKRYRQLTARGKDVNQVVVAIAREMAAFAWAIARLVPVAPHQRNNSAQALLTMCMVIGAVRPPVRNLAQPWMSALSKASAARSPKGSFPKPSCRTAKTAELATMAHAAPIQGASRGRITPRKSTSSATGTAPTTVRVSRARPGHPRAAKPYATLPSAA